MFGDSKPSAGIEKPKKFGEKELAQSIEQFQGTLEDFLKFCHCDFVLESAETEETKKEKERKFF